MILRLQVFYLENNTGRGSIWDKDQYSRESTANTLPRSLDTQFFHTGFKGSGLHA